MFRNILTVSSQSLKRQISNKKPSRGREKIRKSITSQSLDFDHLSANSNFNQNSELKTNNPKPCPRLPPLAQASSKDSTPMPSPLTSPDSPSPDDKYKTQDQENSKSSNKNKKNDSSSESQNSFISAFKSYIRSKFDSMFNKERYIWFFIIPISMIGKEFYDAYLESKFQIFTEEHFFDTVLDSGILQKILIRGEPGELLQVSLFNKSGRNFGSLKIEDSEIFLKSLDQAKLDQVGEEKFQVVHDPVQPDDRLLARYLKPTVLLTGFLAAGIFWLIHNRSPKEFGRRFFEKHAKKVFDAYSSGGKAKRFKDVAGLVQAKKEIQEFVEFLKNPEKFHKLGAKMPRGALMVGPPGTGKTLLAKATAGEAGVAFYPVSGSEFVEKYVGVGASRVRELFETARKNSPSIVFIDEIDAIGRKRGGLHNANEEKDATLNQLLVEMDGFNNDSGVVVLAATNRQDILDKALLRPGRFDRIVELSLPDLKARQDIIKVHLRGLALSCELSVEDYCESLARITPGFSGADLSNLCNEGAIFAAREGKDEVGMEEFNKAYLKAAHGTETSGRMTEKERKILSVHEAGHTVAAWFFTGNSAVFNASILNGAKTQWKTPKNFNESFLLTKNQLIDQICMMLAGGLAENVVFGQATSAAGEDLRKASEIAIDIVEKFGMSAGLTLRFDEERHLSDATKREFEVQVCNIINDCEKRTLGLLSEKKQTLLQLASKLVDLNSLEYADIANILGERPEEEL